MEKISRIVRGNSRVASTDLKNAAPVRPGMPSFGRPVGESTASTPSPTTTAARAVALHNEILEKKKAGGQDEIVQQMADQFFMTRIARPQEQVPEVEISGEGTGDVAADVEAPRGYTPRGSYVDVRA